MPQGTQRKRWIALLSGGLLAAISVGCATAPKSNPAVENGFDSRALRYAATLDSVPLGYRDIIGRVLLGSNPHRLARPVSIAASGRYLYIADAGVGILFRYDLNRKVLHQIGTAGERLVGDAGGMYVAQDGTIYVADPLGQRVLKFSKSGKLLQTFRDAPNLSRPITVAVDEASGRVYVADELYSHIVVFDAEGRAIHGIGARGLTAGPGNFRVITDMAMTPDGLYVTDRNELRVQLLDDQGKYVRNFGQKDLIFPLAIVRDNYGRIYVTDRSDNKMRIFDKKGELIETVGRNGSGPGEFRLANDMVIIGDQLFVADSLNGRIQIFNILPPAAG